MISTFTSGPAHVCKRCWRIVVFTPPIYLGLIACSSCFSSAEESVPAGVAHSLEASLAMKDSIVTDNEDDEDYVQTVQDSDYMNLDSPGHEQGGEWQIIPKRDSFQSTPVVTQYVGTQPVQMPAIPTYIDHSASVNALQPLSSLAQEVYVTSDGEVRFPQSFLSRE